MKRGTETERNAVQAIGGHQNVPRKSELFEDTLEVLITPRPMHLDLRQSGLRILLHVSQTYVQELTAGLFSGRPGSPAAGRRTPGASTLHAGLAVLCFRAAESSWWSGRPLARFGATSPRRSRMLEAAGAGRLPQVPGRAGGRRRRRSGPASAGRPGAGCRSPWSRPH